MRADNRKRTSRVPYLRLVEVLRPADVLLVVPPFAALNSPSLGIHLLQACGRESGFRVHVLYANLLLAGLIGERAYEKIWAPPLGSFAGERFFARRAYGVPPLGRNAKKMFDWTLVIPDADEEVEISPDFSSERPIKLQMLTRLEATSDDFISCLAKAINEVSYKVVGCTTNFEQTSASVALLNQIKALNNTTVTILGGGNCEGEMAAGIASLGASIDHIFSGDSEATFVRFVTATLTGSRPEEQIIRGNPCADLNALPTPAFTEFYEQRKVFLPRSAITADNTEIMYETSRGCWWGQKHHCTFCGINGQGITFRQKNPNRVIEELRTILHSAPTTKVMMTDSIMPYEYFTTLLPRLAAELPPHSISYEQKANLSLPKILALKQAGVTVIAPGIEALSSRILKLIGKGLQARQNVSLLRDARAAHMKVSWALLWGLPGDEIEAYEETFGIIPLLHHLPPPAFLLHLNIDRFSPYFSRPAHFGLTRVKPISTYVDFLPRGANVPQIAYHFTADYKCGSHKGLRVVRKLWESLEEWHAAWPEEQEEPLEDLRLSEQHSGSFLLHDTRRLVGLEKTYVLNRPEAVSLACSRPYSNSPFDSWALDKSLAILVDGWFVPLPVADPRLLLALARDPNTCKTEGARSSSPHMRR